MDPLLRAQSLSPKVWIQIFEEAVSSSGGRKYIILNAQNELQTLDKSEQSSFSGYKFKFREIANITNKLIQTHPEYRIKLEESLFKLANLVIQKYESRPPSSLETIKSLFNKSSFAIAKKIVDKTPLEKTSSTSTQILTTSMEVLSKEKITSFFHSVSEVTESTEGVTGVLFLDSPQGRQVIKFINDPIKIILADYLLTQMGFITPQSTAFSTASEEGASALAMFDKHYPSVLPSEVQSQIDYAKLYAKSRPSEVDVTLTKISMQHRKYKIAAQRVLRNHILYMNYLPAVSWSTATVGEKKRMVEDPQFGKDVGKMVLMDTVIGNPDRLNEDKFNGGNLMLYKQNNKTTIVLVDNECHINADSLPKIEKNLKRFLSDEGKEICKKLAKDVLKNLATEKTVQNLAQNMYTGFVEGALQLLPTLSNTQNFNDILQQFPPSYYVDSSQLGKLRTIIQEQLKSMRLL